MASLNSLNPGRGKAFQLLVQQALAAYFKKPFVMEIAYPIGKPAKDHKFDLVSSDGGVIVETKNYTWTSGNNVPSAKMSVLNEAVFYLQHAPKNTQKVLVINLDRHAGRNETLAEYYVRTYRHLLDDVSVMEFDQNTGFLNKIV
ncbi:hypothetical protein [Paenibacillus sp. SI8]|uniref:hypothetical protein n=1 Tax=unclassified Paenibacillus TaxID=185978 RepID=UPI003464F666